MTGIVLNIQRFSVHDGPGIRTTIFLKGCSLRCFWCHNPEGIRPKPEIQFYPERCIACGECVSVCPQQAHELLNQARVYHRDRCQVCGRCVESCFAGALELAGRPMTVEQVMQEIAPDCAFYASSGGGVTLSGGEPLLQPDFSRAILGRCKSEGWHTAIETSGNGRWDDLAALLPVTDLIMMDIKHLDPVKHRAVTGVPNERILDNARRLVHAGARILFRVPVIPTVNDTPEEIQAIAAFVRRLAQQRPHQRDASLAEAPCLELLPFHRLASDKYRSLGLDYGAGSLAGLAKDKMSLLAGIVQAQGVAVRGEAL